jgi:uncharacterized protein (TIGR03083 family)
MGPFYRLTALPVVWQSARMPDDKVLDGLDPYDIMDTEAVRIDRFVVALGPTDLEAPSACAGWSVQDVVAHLAGGEEYNQACLDDGIGALFERLGAVGVTDMDSFNAYGVREWAGHPIEEVLGVWRRRCERTRTELRHRDGEELPTAVGLYPVRWQAFHLASELVTHGDDIGAPPSGRSDEWRARFAVFAVSETKPEITIALQPGTARVCRDDREVTLTTEDLVAATNGRLAPEHPLDPALRSALNVVGS